MFRKNATKAQATLELAVFASLMLIVLFTAFNYRRMLNEQHDLEGVVFEKALEEAHKHEDINYIPDPESEDGDLIENRVRGATASYTQQTEKQANLIYNPQRRSSAASYTDYWSNAEHPPPITRHQIIGPDGNPIELDYPDRIIVTMPRDDDAEGTYADELQMNTAQKAILLCSVIHNLLDGVFSNIWDAYAEFSDEFNIGAAGVVLRVILLGTYWADWDDIEDALDASKDRMKELARQDEAYGEFYGLRVATQTDQVVFGDGVVVTDDDDDGGDGNGGNPLELCLDTCDLEYQACLAEPGNTETTCNYFLAGCRDLCHQMSGGDGDDDNDGGGDIILPVDDTILIIGDEVEAGKVYLKEVYPQINTTDLRETQASTFTKTTNIDKNEYVPGGTRSIDLTHNVAHEFRLRYDVTLPDPNTPIEQLDYPTPAERSYRNSVTLNATIDLGGSHSGQW